MVHVNLTIVHAKLKRITVINEAGLGRESSRGCLCMALAGALASGTIVLGCHCLVMAHHITSRGSPGYCVISRSFVLKLLEASPIFV